MSFNQRNNPLKDVKVEVRELCASREHYANLIIWGMCLPCGRTFGLQTENESVWQRVKDLKKFV